MKKTGLVVAFLFLFFATPIFSQSYESAIGVRLGSSFGITYKKFFRQNTAFEGILLTRWNGIGVIGLVEYHKYPFPVDDLNLYFGFGAHAVFFEGTTNHNWFDNDEFHTLVGIDGIFGLEYNFPDIPLNLSIDWKPAINLFEHTGFWGDEGALSVRFYF